MAVFSMNILALFNPIFGASRFFMQHDFHPDFKPFGQYEGFLYLGAGMLLMVVMAAGICLTVPRSTAKSLVRRYWPLAARRWSSGCWLSPTRSCWAN